ncbi:MAG: metallophosphatase [Candidatus Sericytochromatia bacterium]|nr:MAG: metallophosphatase [Candidatus Sericytochromatia bacterium]
MKVQFVSDLHLEYEENRNYFKENPIKEFGEVLILAGDIVNEIDREKANDFFEDIEKKFDLIISAFGNHEFYLNNLDFSLPSYKKELSKNHLLLNNETICYKNCRFIISTLWSKIEEKHRYEISNRLNDYKYIKYKNEKFSTYHSDEVFEICKNFIISELEKYFKGKTIVITHHLPSYECVNPKWRNSNLASGFVNKLDDLILKYEPDFWIFGHQHEYSECKIGNTILLSNPLGYFKKENFKLFSSNKYFEV